MQCTGILLVHENNTWQNFTENEGFESAGRAVWILPGVAKILATLLSTGAFATDERGMARVLMHPPARTLETSSHELCFLSHNAARAARRPTGDPQITPSNRTKFMQTRRQTDISYKQRRKSYKIPDFHTHRMDFITFK